MGFADVTFDDAFIKEVVRDSNQDIRKAINTLHFYHSNVQKERKDAVQEGLELSPEQLASLDVTLTTCEHREGQSKILWTANILSNIDFVPDTSNLRNWTIPSVDTNNEHFISGMLLFIHQYLNCYHHF